LSTPQSGLLDKTRYGFNSRFGDEGTNPGFSRCAPAVSPWRCRPSLGGRLHPTSLDTEAKVDLSLEGGPQLSQIRLKVKAWCRVSTRRSSVRLPMTPSRTARCPRR
jgi:osmotically inducible protein OsmC